MLFKAILFHHRDWQRWERLETIGPPSPGAVTLLTTSYWYRLPVFQRIPLPIRDFWGESFWIPMHVQHRGLQPLSAASVSPKAAPHFICCLAFLSCPGST